MDQLIDIRVPDIGDLTDIPVVEVSVVVGDVVSAGDVVIVLESAKATLEVPASASGSVVEILIALGDVASQDTLILRLEASFDSQQNTGLSNGSTPDSTTRGNEQLPDAALNTTIQMSPDSALPVKPKDNATSATTGKSTDATPRISDQNFSEHVGGAMAYASPSVRRYARVLGVPINDVVGTGKKQRITAQDIEAYVNVKMNSDATMAPMQEGYHPLQSLPDWPSIDFSRFGPVESRPLKRISRIAGPALARNALVIPHVTNFDKADITDLEAFRKRTNATLGDETARLTILAFAVRAVVSALKDYPEFNTSLDGDCLIYKEYWHIGVATDTPEGLLVPVIKHADTKGLREIAHELRELAASARAGKLKPTDMQGATFTISSIGGIGGTQFTPIINAPEVAILGMSRSELQPVWHGDAFAPRLMQPLCLSWDHRVVNGADAARFLSRVSAVLADLPLLSL